MCGVFMLCNWDVEDRVAEKTHHNTYDTIHKHIPTHTHKHIYTNTYVNFHSLFCVPLSDKHALASVSSLSNMLFMASSVSFTSSLISANLLWYVFVSVSVCVCVCMYGCVWV